MNIRRNVKKNKLRKNKFITKSYVYSKYNQWFFVISTLLNLIQRNSLNNPKMLKGIKSLLHVFIHQVSLSPSLASSLLPSILDSHSHFTCSLYQRHKESCPSLSLLFTPIPESFWLKLDLKTEKF